MRINTYRQIYTRLIFVAPRLYIGNKLSYEFSYFNFLNLIDSYGLRF